MTEYEFSRIWKGIHKKIDMRKISRYKTREEQLKQFKKQLSALPGTTKNLSKMNEENISTLFNISFVKREKQIRDKLKKIRGKKILSPQDQKNISEYENIKRIKKELEKSKIEKARTIERSIEKEELITQNLRKQKIKIKTFQPERKGTKGRIPKRKKAISLFKRKTTVTGKTKNFKAIGEITTKKGIAWILSFNSKTGKVKARNKETGRYMTL